MTKVQLFVDKPLYYPGDLVRGSVHVECEKPQKVRGIMLEASGYEQTRITESHGVGKHRHTHTYVSNNFLLRFGQPLLNECELPCGRYDYPFQYALPAQALPTYHGFCSNVMYAVTANVDIPYWFDAHQTVETPVVIPSSQVALERKPATLYSQNASNTAQPGFMMTVGSTMFFSGDPIKGNFMLTGHGGHTVRKVDIELQIIEQAVAQGHSRLSNQVIARSEIPGSYLVPGATVPFAMDIPSQITTVFNGIYTKVWYALVINLDVAWAFDTTASLPLVILERA